MTSQISDSLTEIKEYSVCYKITKHAIVILYFFLISTLPYPHNYHLYQHRFDDRSNDYVNIHLRDERTSPLKIIDLS